MLENKNKATAVEGSANHHLDITREKCPMTFVRVKLMIEKALSGETIEIRLQGSEPLRNIPASAKELGHEVIHIAREKGEEDPHGMHRIIIRKA